MPERKHAPVTHIETTLRDPEDVEQFRGLLPEKQQEVAEIYGVTSIAGSWATHASVSIRFKGIRRDGTPYVAFRDHYVPDLTDAWMPLCFPDPRVRNVAQRLLDDQRWERAHV